MAARKKAKKVSNEMLDRYYSLLIRGRVENRCEKCNDNFRPQCSHHISRSKSLKLRWAPENACCHCASCHKSLTENPFDHYEWIEKHIGKKAWEGLMSQTHKTNVYGQPARRDMLQSLKDSWAWMQQQRREGVEGRLEFDSPYEDGQ